MIRDSLTAPQQRVLNFIEYFLLVNEYPPSHREIGEALGFKCPSGAWHHMKMLERKGYIKTRPRVSRSIQILHPEDSHA